MAATQGTPGGVTPNGLGLWAVEFPSGAAAIYGRSRLPNQTPGVRRQYLGNTPSQVNSAIFRVLGNWGLDVSTIPQFGSIADLRKAQTKPVGIAGDWNAPGAGGPKPFQRPTGAPATAPGATYNGGPFGFDFSAVTDFLNYAGWILHPLNWLRMVEFFSGIILSLIGIALLAKSGSRGGVTARSVVRTIPGGRVMLNNRRGQREAREQREVNEGRQQWKNSNP